MEWDYWSVWGTPPSLPLRKSLSWSQFKKISWDQSSENFGHEILTWIRSADLTWESVENLISKSVENLMWESVENLIWSDQVRTHVPNSQLTYNLSWLEISLRSTRKNVMRLKKLRNIENKFVCITIKRNFTQCKLNIDHV